VSDLDEARVVSLTTFKRDGSGVSTLVWITGSAGSYAISTGGASWKVRRLKHSPKVEVRVSDMRGRVSPSAAVHTGTGEIVVTPEVVRDVQAAIAKKYGALSSIVKVMDKVRGLLGRGVGERVVVRLTLD
jgi:uncharacterized protein